MPPINNSYFLQWKGRETGPFTIEEIKAKLDTNEIGLLHSVRDQSGSNTTLDELLAKMNASQLAEQRRDEERRRQRNQELENDRIQAAYEEKLAVEQNKHQELQNRLKEVEGKMATAYPPPPPRQAPRYQQPEYHGTRRTSSFAITALVMSVLNFVPFVNFVSWILAIIFGHIALSQIEKDPELEGHGMAVTALAITYGLLVIGFMFGIFYVANKHF